jgi:hypothetical protein
MNIAFEKLSKSAKASPACSSGERNMQMKMGVEKW